MSASLTAALGLGYLLVYSAIGQATTLPPQCGFCCATESLCDVSGSVCLCQTSFCSTVLQSSGSGTTSRSAAEQATISAIPENIGAIYGLIPPPFGMSSPILQQSASNTASEISSSTIPAESTPSAYRIAPASGSATSSTNMFAEEDGTRVDSSASSTARASINTAAPSTPPSSGAAGTRVKTRARRRITMPESSWLSVPKYMHMHNSSEFQGVPGDPDAGSGGGPPTERPEVTPQPGISGKARIRKSPEKESGDPVDSTARRAGAYKRSMKSRDAVLRHSRLGRVKLLQLRSVLLGLAIAHRTHGFPPALRAPKGNHSIHRLQGFHPSHMSSVAGPHTHYDRSLAAQAPAATRAQLQEGYDTTPLAPNRRPPSRPSDLALNEVAEAEKSLTRGPRNTTHVGQSISGWQRQRWRIAGLLITLVVVGAIVGGAVGATVRRRQHSQPQALASAGVGEGSVVDASVSGAAVVTASLATESIFTIAVAAQPAASFAQATPRLRAHGARRRRQKRISA
ncbi:hypothetical protein GGX14DRAFT_662655 [Mycena pura]|uniref:Extracellular membrane protein CFEM domain-containing protein n=1 Tax=Mycena pura TaxID=153505 RepID=A0AAD6VVR2_9AGAR|nr:hypothetical protein GGX14DRAFT_662655 [Mycena pura]